jgi:nitroreductase
MSDESQTQTQNVIQTRRTVHRYRSEPLPEGTIDRALEAAVAAPNHKLTNPWRFTKVGPETRQKVEDLYVRLKAQDGSLTDEQEEDYRRKVGNPSELIVVSQIWTDDDFQRREDYGAVACAIQNLMLSLWSEGVHSKWTTGSVTRHDDTYEMMGIDPDDEEIVGFIWIGYPREDREGLDKPPRRPLDEVTREVP